MKAIMTLCIAGTLMFASTALAQLAPKTSASMFNRYEPERTHVSVAAEPPAVAARELPVATLTLRKAPDRQLCLYVTVGGGQTGAAAPTQTDIRGQALITFRLRLGTIAGP